jgi:hypothetical protein
MLHNGEELVRLAIVKAARCAKVLSKDKEASHVHGKAHHDVVEVCLLPRAAAQEVVYDLVQAPSNDREVVPVRHQCKVSKRAVLA